MATPDLQTYYAARAREYDRVYDKPERQADLCQIERWLPPRFAGATVLEVACGTGYWTRFIAPVASALVAIDAAPETLEVARDRVCGGRIEFRVGDAWALAPAAPNAPPFDAAFAGFWFSHVPLGRRLDFLRGLNAALVPGARVVLLDNRYVEGSSSPIAERSEAGDTYQTRRLEDGSTHRVLKNFPAEEELLALLSGGLGESPAVTLWPHYWALEYRVPTQERST